MRPPSDILRQLIIDLELGSEDSAWRTFTAFHPDDPDASICVYDTAGRPDGRLMSTGERIEHPGFQIALRHRSYLSGWERAILLANTLDQQRRVVVDFPDGDAYMIHNISRMGTVIPLGMEIDSPKRRHSFTINGTLTVTTYAESFLVAEGAFSVMPGSDPYFVRL
jgi:Bacteriophage minor capsid protein